MSRKPIRKITPKQKKFADLFIQNNLSNSYQCAIKAGYSKSYAHDHSYELSENIGIRHYIRSTTNRFVQGDWRNDVLNRLVMKNMYAKATGLAKKSRYQKIDNKDPTQSTDITLIGPPAGRDQVEAGKSLLKYVMSPVAQSQVKKLNAETEKEKAVARIKEILAKQANTSNNQTISKVDELLDQIFKDGKR